MEKRNKYSPDIAIPPGVTLLEVLEELGMTQAELAERTARPTKTINEIIKGKAAITPETALQLETVLKVPARFWNNLEMNYRETLARIEEREVLQAQLEWLKGVPVNCMARFGWIKKNSDSIEQLKEVLSFFGVASVKGWEKTWDKQLGCAFRKSTKYEMDSIALAAWLRAGQLEAKDVACQPFDSERFLGILPDIRKLTITDPDVFVTKVRELCSATGVAVIFVRELPKLPVNGVTYWPSTSKAIIQLTLRYKADDQLWFSFFHEAAHILKHGKRDFYEEFSDDTEGWEQEANAFAADLLIPADAFKYFASRRIFDEHTIQVFANSVGIAPGIVVGRLQHGGLLSYSSRLNRLKKKFVWAE